MNSTGYETLKRVQGDKKRLFQQPANKQAELFVKRYKLPDEIVTIITRLFGATNGHEEGDRALQELSKLLTAVTRKDSVVARFGGKEFILMLPGYQKKTPVSMPND